MSITRADVQVAIKCPDWQALRLSLKGITTEMKLRRLRSYISSSANKPYASNLECTCDGNYDMRAVQVLNYLTALTRGGQLEPIPAELQFIGRVYDLLHKDMLVIRR